MVQSALIAQVFSFLRLEKGKLDQLPTELRKALGESGQPEIIIGICGGEECDGETAQIAEQVGYWVAKRSATVLTGGRRGVMEAACRGAKRAGGFTLAILPGPDSTEANSYVDLAIPTGWGWARNYLIPLVSDAIIAIDGEYGTLSEVAFALEMKRPVVALRPSYWSVVGLPVVTTPEEAVQLIWQRLNRTGIHGAQS